jgi:hypothetical protein
MFGLLTRIRHWWLCFVERDLESSIHDLEFELKNMGFQEEPNSDIAKEMCRMLVMDKKRLKAIRLKKAIIKLRTEGPYLSD